MEALTREEEKGKNGDSQVKQKNNIGEVSREMEERVIQGSSINEVEGVIDLGQKRMIDLNCSYLVKKGIFVIKD